jgi:hypothetical protein
MYSQKAYEFSTGIAGCSYNTGVHWEKEKFMTG